MLARLDRELSQERDRVDRQRAEDRDDDAERFRPIRRNLIEGRLRAGECIMAISATTSYCGEHHAKFAPIQAVKSARKLLC